MRSALAGAGAVAAAAAAAAFGLAACSGSTGPKYPALAGTYNAFFTLTFNNAQNTGQNGSTALLGSITLGAPDSKGAFTGSYVYTAGAVSEGIIAGILGTNGSITITQFGDPGQDLGNDASFLENTFTNCDISSAIVATPYGGSVSGGSLVLTGVTDFPCSYFVAPGDNISVPTTLADAITASRT
jgi:hypothetical protein